MAGRSLAPFPVRSSRRQRPPLPTTHVPGCSAPRYRNMLSTLFGCATALARSRPNRPRGGHERGNAGADNTGAGWNLLDEACRGPERRPIRPERRERCRADSAPPARRMRATLPDQRRCDPKGSDLIGNGLRTASHTRLGRSDPRPIRPTSDGSRHGRSSRPPDRCCVLDHRPHPPYG